MEHTRDRQTRRTTCGMDTDQTGHGMGYIVHVLYTHDQASKGRDNYFPVVSPGRERNETERRRKRTRRDASQQSRSPSPVIPDGDRQTDKQSRSSNDKKTDFHHFVNQQSQAGEGIILLPPRQRIQPPQPQPRNRRFRMPMPLLLPRLPLPLTLRLQTNRTGNTRRRLRRGSGYSLPLIFCEDIFESDVEFGGCAGWGEGGVFVEDFDEAGDGGC